MTGKLKVLLLILVFVFGVNVVIHWTTEWGKLSDSQNAPHGMAFVSTLVWNMFAVLIELMITPVGILMMVGLIALFVASRKKSAP